MLSLKCRGMENAVQSSDTGLNELQGLASGFACLTKLRNRPRGGRRHRLRFPLDGLIHVCKRAEVLYDISLGWSESIEFRGGAYLAFHPYNFKHELASTFLQIPHRVMDEKLVGDESSRGELAGSCRRVAFRGEAPWVRWLTAASTSGCV